MKTVEPLPSREARAENLAVETEKLETEKMARSDAARSSSKRSSFKRWRVPAKVANVYLWRGIVVASLRGLLWFGGLLSMTILLGAIRRVVDGTLGWSGVWDLVLAETPRVLVFTLPMSVLFGAVQWFTELSSHGEATALQVGGMSLGRMMRAPLCWGAIVGLCVFVLQEKFVPQTQQSKQNIIAQSMIGVSRPQPFRLSDPSDGQGALKSVIQAKLLDIGRGTMQQPVVQLFGENQHLYKQIAAPRGVWRAETRRWILQNAIVTLISGDKVVVSPPRDIEYSMPAPTELGRKTLTLTQYLNDGYYEFASISDLRAYRDVLLAQKPRNSADSHLRQKRINSMTYGIHDKITALFLCVFLVLVGAPLALQSGRTATGFSMGLSLAVLLGYYLLWTCTLALGRGGEINPIALAYFPLGVTATVGVFLFWRKAR